MTSDPRIVVDWENDLIRVSLPSSDVADGPDLMRGIDRAAMKLLGMRISFPVPPPLKRYLENDGTTMMISVLGKPVYGNRRATTITGFIIEVENSEGEKASARVEIAVGPS